MEKTTMDISVRKVSPKVHAQIEAKIKAAGGFKAYIDKAKKEGRHSKPEEYSLKHSSTN